MPTFAAANRLQLAYVLESTFGTIPTTGNPYALRNTGESLKFNLSKENDKELNPNAELTSMTTTGAQAEGDIKVHLQYAEYDRFLAGLMRSTWAAYGTNGVGAAFNVTSVTAGVLGTTSTVITAGAAPTGTSAFSNLVAGQWILVDLPGAVNNPTTDNLVRVLSTNGTTTITLDVNTPLKAEGAITGAVISGSRISNGVTLQPFSIEKQMLDVGQYHTFRGMNVSKFSTTFASKSLTEATFTFLGKDMLSNGTTQLTGTVAASKTYDIQNGVRGLGQLWEGGAPLTSTSIKSISFDIDSGLRAQDAAGVLGLVGVGIGTFKVTGKITVYFANGALFAKFLADTYTSFIVSTQDSVGNGYVFTVPKAMLSDGQVLAGGQDTDMMAEFSFTAVSDKGNAVAALRKTLIIDRVGDAVAP
jgi:hypothetical protein